LGIQKTPNIITVVAAPLNSRPKSAHPRNLQEDQIKSSILLLISPKSLHIATGALTALHDLATSTLRALGNGVRNIS
jgi:hypothetical protein